MKSKLNGKLAEAISIQRHKVILLAYEFEIDPYEFFQAITMNSKVDITDERYHLIALHVGLDPIDIYDADLEYTDLFVNMEVKHG